MSNVWDYRESVWDYREHTWTLDSDLVGYDVDATDGRIGKIHHAASRTSDAFVVVDTGSWISDARRLIPAGAVTSLDHDRRRVQVDLTTAQISEAPDYSADQWDDEVRRQHGDYYSRCSR